MMSAPRVTRIGLLLVPLLLLLTAYVHSSPSQQQGSSQTYTHYSASLVDVITAITSQAPASSQKAIASGVRLCLESELPESSNIWTDEVRGKRNKEGGEPPAAYLSRMLLGEHTDIAGFVSCMFSHRSISSGIVSKSLAAGLTSGGGNLLFAAASLVATTPDPTALLEGVLRVGAPLDYTLGTPAVLSAIYKQQQDHKSSLKKEEESLSLSLPLHSSGDGYNIFHKVLSRDKVMLGDVTNRLLKPSGGVALGGHYGIYLSAVGESVAKKLTSYSEQSPRSCSTSSSSSTGKNGDDSKGPTTTTTTEKETIKSTSASSSPLSFSSSSTIQNALKEESGRIRKAVKSLLNTGDVQTDMYNGTQMVLGRRVGYAHLQTLNNALGQVSLLTLLGYLRNYTATTTNTDITPRNQNDQYLRSLFLLVGQQDRYGRTPMHVATTTDNVVAILLILEEIKCYAASNSDNNNNNNDDASNPTSLAFESLLTSLLTTKDVFGYTPRTLATLLGSAKSAKVLADAEALVGLHTTGSISSSSDDDASAREVGMEVYTSEMKAQATPLRRPYHSRKSTTSSTINSRILGYNEAGLLVDITRNRGKALKVINVDGSQSGEGVKAEMSNTINSDENKNGGWGRPVSVAPRFSAAVDAAVSSLSSTSSSSSLPPRCDFDVIDFSCVGARCAATTAPPPGGSSIAITSNQTLSAADFVREFYVPNRPVLLRGLARDWPLKDSFTVDSILSRHGFANVSTVDIPYAPIFGGGSSVVTLAQHIRGLLLCPEAVVGSNATEEGETGNNNNNNNNNSNLLQYPEGLDAKICSLYTAPLSAAVDEREKMTGTNKKQNVIGEKKDNKKSDNFADDRDDNDDNEEEEEDDQEAKTKKNKLSTHRPYLFHRLQPGDPLSASLADDLTILPWFLRTKLPNIDTASTNIAFQLPLESLMLPHPAPPSPQFYIGGPGTGAPCHYHEDAWNVLAYGEKVWYLTHPSAAEYSTVPVSEYVLDVLPRVKRALGVNENSTFTTTTSSSKSTSWLAGVGDSSTRMPLTCIQQAGDVIYVPYGWGHAVLNTRTSVGYAVEWASPFMNRY